MPVSCLHIALASLGGTVAYFAFGFALFAALPAMKSEFMKYPNVYRSEQNMMKKMPFGMVAILVSIVVVAVLYAKMYALGGGIVSGLCLGALIGIFAVWLRRKDEACSVGTIAIVFTARKGCALRSAKVDEPCAKSISERAR